MSSAAIVTVIKMLESLPEGAQEQAVEHLREYLADLQDEWQWDTLIKKKKDSLHTAVQHAKKQIAEGQAEPMDFDRL